ncbi:MAG: invasion protein [Xanthomonadales bacterium]|nr:invasion protein [Xanthomonadales bacterium]
MIPHVVDTLLLISAFAMIALADQVPVGMDWLSAKIAGLVVYILPGIIAMHSAPVKSRSVPAFVAAVLVFCWIVSVAVSKSPWGFLSWVNS